MHVLLQYGERNAPQAKSSYESVFNMLTLCWSTAYYI